MNLVETWSKRTYGRACPRCGSWNLKPQMPIKMNEPITPDMDARKILSAYAKATKDGNTPLEGPCFIMCFGCGHKCPAVDCSGRTSEDVRMDKDVFDEMKRLWREHVYNKPHDEQKSSS